VTGWQDEVVDFWFGLKPEQWWKADPALDELVRERFEPLWREQRAFPAAHFLANARGALAAILLFDQFPRNMYRGHAEQFATDHLALVLAGEAVEREYDAELSETERPFLYMPFEHSEKLGDQRRAVALFTALGNADLLDFARKHHDVIARFGRFPHRNAMLGRAPRSDEIAAGDVTPF